MDVFELMAKLGLDTSEYEEGLKGAESKASNFGSALKSGIGTAAKVATAATAAAATAVGAMTKTAVDGFKDYEQLAGGVETLFGSSAQKVLKDSQKAFTDAGMSQNQYLETSIQSAAALINSLEGDQAKAADLMNVSIVDMADNVNKMGTSMEGVQNAYRGFSRGNFTMLDNLALGFAGTKEGMQELLDKAKELSGVDYNIDSYADIVQAIHVVQKEMGIAGTTGAEAAGTIQGSLAQLGAAWQNLVAGLANPDADLGALIDNVVSSAETALTNLLPAIENALGGIANLIEKLAPIIADKLPGLIDKILPPLLNAATDLLSGLASALPGIISTVLTAAPDVIAALLQAGFDMILEIANGMTQPGAMDSFMNTILNIIDSIVTWISEYADVLILAGVQIVITLLEGLTDPEAIGRMVDTSILLVTSLAEAIIKAVPELIKAAPVIVLNLVKAIIENVPKLGEAALELIKGLGAALVGFLPELKNAGSTLMDGLSETIGGSSAVEKIKSGFSNLADAITNSEFVQAFVLMGEDISKWWDDVTATFEYAFEIIKGVWEENWHAIKDFFAPIIEAIKYTAGAAFEWIEAKVTAYLQNLRDTYMTIWNAIVAFFTPIMETIKEVATSAWQKIQEIVLPILETIRGAVETAYNFIEEHIFSKILAVQDKMAEVWENIKNTMTEKIQSAVDTVKELFNGLGEFFGGLAEKAAKWGSDMMDGFKQGIKDGRDKVASSIRGVGDKIKANIGHSHPTEGPLADDYKWMSDMMDLFAGGIKSNAGKVTGALDDLTGDMYDTMDFSQPQFQLAGGYGIMDMGTGSSAGGGDYGDVITAITDALMNMQLMVNIGNRPIEAMITSAQQRTTYRSGGR